MAYVEQSTPLRVTKPAKAEAMLVAGFAPQQCTIVALRFISIVEAFEGSLKAKAPTLCGSVLCLLN